uniref:Dirigent protein n=1 Tax=Craspedostauros australis TaxID=1486917 RepID=A0A7R9ZSC9_9STRA|mmetsp:Transcript_8395/g.22721  ORF Transcript_8395/g.22721 Transcript_8395/m.22721 type:complete len:168 (+) Transcript_8395:187-690(+)|eukprot:CAMPEP_0198131342 /NCGR_PEP_ID=MMETSP1442-20131203/55980_1 /TAXON_ID= /ORGANISM="Craspedostauros australis, Strain CCMP3328" /LENGTH=167 /DNA_ID=CAMNT_0043792141 /DNA_START=158 /DNA_END=661 /DNA_ORIENTATION=+
MTRFSTWLNFTLVAILPMMARSSPALRSRQLNSNTLAFQAELNMGTPLEDTANLIGATSAINGTIIDQTTNTPTGSMFGTCTVVEITPTDQTNLYCQHHLSFFDTTGESGFGQIVVAGTMKVAQNNGGQFVVTGTSGDFADKTGGLLQLLFMTAQLPLQVQGVLSLA